MIDAVALAFNFDLFVPFVQIVVFPFVLMFVVELRKDDIGRFPIREMRYLRLWKGRVRQNFASCRCLRWGFAVVSGNNPSATGEVHRMISMVVGFVQ